MQVALSPETPSSRPLPPAGIKLVVIYSLNFAPEIWAQTSHCPPNISTWVSNRYLRVDVSHRTLLPSETSPMLPAQLSPESSPSSSTKHQGVTLASVLLCTHVQTLSRSRQPHLHSGTQTQPFITNLTARLPARPSSPGPPSLTWPGPLREPPAWAHYRGFTQSSQRDAFKQTSRELSRGFPSSL